MRAIHRKKVIICKVHTNETDGLGAHMRGKAKRQEWRRGRAANVIESIRVIEMGQIRMSNRASHYVFRVHPHIAGNKNVPRLRLLNIAQPVGMKGLRLVHAE
jgi:hypothetical protein